jgi:lipoprotein signal peptidase
VAEQAAEMVEGPGGAPVPYDPAHLKHNSGRPVSWVGTMTAIVGFIVGGIAFPISNPAPNWIVFWIGTAIAILGILVLAFSKAIDTDWY